MHCGMHSRQGQSKYLGSNWWGSRSTREHKYRQERVSHPTELWGYSLWRVRLRHFPDPIETNWRAAVVLWHLRQTRLYFTQQKNSSLFNLFELDGAPVIKEMAALLRHGSFDFIHPPTQSQATAGDNPQFECPPPPPPSSQADFVSSRLSQLLSQTIIINHQTNFSAALVANLA